MAWTSMHFAVGMGCAGVGAAAVCALTRRGWRWLPLALTAGGLWAIVPDLPRIFREDFPGLPLVRVLGRKSLEETLHNWGDLFFFHRSLDVYHHGQYALHGLFLIILFYNLGLGLLLFMEHRQRHSIGNRAWNAHAPFLDRPRLDPRIGPRAPALRLTAPMPRVRSSHYGRVS